MLGERLRRSPSIVPASVQHLVATSCKQDHAIQLWQMTSDNFSVVIEKHASPSLLVDL